MFYIYIYIYKGLIAVNRAHCKCDRNSSSDELARKRAWRTSAGSNERSTAEWAFLLSRDVCAH